MIEISPDVELDFSRENCRMLIVNTSDGPAFSVEANVVRVVKSIAYCFWREYKTEQKEETEWVQNPAYRNTGGYSNGRNRYIEKPTGKFYDSEYSEIRFISCVSNFTQIEPIFEGDRTMYRE